MSDVAATPYLEHDGPIPLAHRGFSQEGLENSMSAFAAAVALGYHYVETDVHATQDGVLVAFHDTRLDRVTDRTGSITGMPWAEVSGARIGGVEPVPRLEEILDTWPELRVNIDIKTSGAIVPLVRAIERTNAHDRVCVTSFSDHRRAAALRRLSRPVATSAGQRTVARFLAAARLPRRREAALARVLRGVDCLQVPEDFGRIKVVNAATLEAAHAVGVQVHVWTVNDDADMHRLLDLGVDGLVSDRADLLKQVLQERGTWS